MAARRVRLALIPVIVLATATTIAYVELHARPVAPVLTMASVDRGDVVESVIATGTLQPTRSVTVGAQVSGTIARVRVDFNSIVHPGDVLAEIDPSVIQATLDSAKAALAESRIALDAETTTRDSDQRTTERMDALFPRGIETAQDREAAELQLESDDAQIKQDEDDIRVAEANVSSAALDLAHCTITSPIDGVVIAREVDAGQTVQSRVVTPAMFQLGTDLTSLLLVGDVDESDIARVRPGQPVTFTVDAYPQTFHGTVVESRLNATNTSNVVTYQTVISVSNPTRQLLPGMTASFKIETARATNVLRVSNTALRFRPTSDVLAYYHEPLTPAAAANGNPTLGMLAFTPAAPSRAASANTIDQMFAPFARRETAGHVWIADGGFRAIPVTLGLTDGQWTEVREDTLRVGQAVIVNATMPPKPRR